MHALDHLAALGPVLPDRIELIEAVPKTSVGKFDKKALRARFAAPGQARHAIVL